jgi:hypothetical protein
MDNDRIAGSAKDFAGKVEDAVASSGSDRAQLANMAKQAKGPGPLEFVQEALVVDVESERLGGAVKIGAIDEERNLGCCGRHSARSNWSGAASRPHGSGYCY